MLANNIYCSHCHFDGKEENFTVFSFIALNVHNHSLQLENNRKNKWMKQYIQLSKTIKCFNLPYALLMKVLKLKMDLKKRINLDKNSQYRSLIRLKWPIRNKLKTVKKWIETINETKKTVILLLVIKRVCNSGIKIHISSFYIIICINHIAVFVSNVNTTTKVNMIRRNLHKVSTFRHYFFSSGMHRPRKRVYFGTILIKK